MVPAQQLPSRLDARHLVVDQQVDGTGLGKRERRPHVARRHDTQAATLDHRRSAHADARTARGNHQITTAQQGGVAGETVALDDADARHHAGQRGQAVKGRAVEPRHHRPVDIARPATAALGKQHHRQLQRGRQFEQPIGLPVVERALRASQHGVVVDHRRATCAFDAELRRLHGAQPGDQAVGRGVALQVVDVAAAALRGHRKGTVLDEAAVVEQCGQVLAGGAPAQRMARSHHVGPGGVVEQGAARDQRRRRSVAGRGRGRRRISGGARQRAGRRRGLGQQIDQRIAVIHRVARAHVDGVDNAVDFGLDRELHLHRLQAQQHTPAPHGAADVQLDRGDGALDGGTVRQDSTHGVCPARRGEAMW